MYFHEIVAIQKYINANWLTLWSVLGGVFSCSREDADCLPNKDSYDGGCESSNFPDKSEKYIPAISQDHNIDERICNQLAVSLILKKLQSFSCAHTLNVGHALLWGFSSSLSSLCLNLEFKGTTDLVCEKVMLQ